MPEATSPEKTHRSPVRRIVRALCGALLVLLLLWALGALGFRIWRWVEVPAGAPVIGISLDTAWYAQLGVTSAPYVAALSRVGADVFPIRPGATAAAEALDRIDGLLLSGGGDVDPALYGGDPLQAKLVERARDDLEIALIRGARQRDMPILGICRGIQILNVARGGSLRTLRGDPAFNRVHGITPRSLRAHAATVREGSRLADIIGAGQLDVNSFHGQAVDRLGESLTIAAVAADGVVEAIEGTDRRLVIGIQWHPELLSLEDPQSLRIFEEFVRQAADYRRSRAGQ